MSLEISEAFNCLIHLKVEYGVQCVCGWVLSIAKLGTLFSYKVSQVHTELTSDQECHCKIV